MMRRSWLGHWWLERHGYPRIFTSKAECVRGQLLTQTTTPSEVAHNSLKLVIPAQAGTHGKPNTKQLYLVLCQQF